MGDVVDDGTTTFESIIVIEVLPYKVTYGVFTSSRPSEEPPVYLSASGDWELDWRNVTPHTTTHAKFDGDTRLYTQEWCFESTDVVATVLRRVEEHAAKVFPDRP